MKEEIETGRNIGTVTANLTHDEWNLVLKHRDLAKAKHEVTMLESERATLQTRLGTIESRLSDLYKVCPESIRMCSFSTSGYSCQLPDGHLGDHNC